jgi:hypothetical protein
MKLFLLLTQRGRPRSPELLAESELEPGSDVYEVSAPWDRPLPINPGGRGKSSYGELAEGDDVTHIRVPTSIAPIVKSFAVWLYSSK